MRNSRPKCINHLYNRCHELFTLDTEVGKLYRKIKTNNSSQVGEEVGCAVNKRYIRVKIDGNSYPAHRIIWLMVHGEIDPDLQVDHIDNDGTNNMIKNLRLVNHRENMSNQKRKKEGKTTSKYVGVCFDKDRGRWLAYITIDGKRNQLGRFYSELEACLAYQSALKELENAD